MEGTKPAVLHNVALLQPLLPFFGPRARWPGGEPLRASGALEFLQRPAHQVHTWVGGGPRYKTPFGGP